MSPGVWTPPRGRRRPAWPFSVNWDHPLTAHLIVYFPIIPFGLQNSQPNLASERSALPATIPKAGSDAFSWVADDMFGFLPTFPGGSTAATFPRYEYSFETYGGTQPFSIIVWARPTATVGANDDTICMNTDVSASNRYFRMEPNPTASEGTVGGLRVISNENGTFVSAVTDNLFVQNKWSHCAGIWTGNSERRAILDGDLSNAETNTETQNVNASLIDEFCIGWENDSSPGDGFEGQIADLFVFNKALTDAEVIEHYDNPFDMVYALGRKIWLLPSAAPTGQTIAVGLVTETDLAQPVTAAKARALGQALETDLAQPVDVEPLRRLINQALETDLAQPVTSAKARALGQVLETDLAQALTAVKSRILGQVLETDLAQPITAAKLLTLGQVVEVDLAQPVTSAKARALGQVLETDLAQALTAVKSRILGQVTETDLAFELIAQGQQVAIELVTDTDPAQPLDLEPPRQLTGQALENDTPHGLTSAKALGIGLTLETDLAQALTAVKSRILGQVTETDLAQPVASAKLKALGQVLETDLAQALTAVKSRILGQVLETDLAQALTIAKARAIGQVLETDLALPFLFAPPAEPGLEYSVRPNRLHYDGRGNLLHFDVSTDRLHYGVTADLAHFDAQGNRIHYDAPDED